MEKTKKAHPLYVEENPAVKRRRETKLQHLAFLAAGGAISREKLEKLRKEAMEMTI